MHFEYTRRRSARRAIAETATFRVAHLSRLPQRDAPGLDVSHLLDRSYEYHSPRELRWHLADRFGLSPDIVSVRESA